MNVARNSHLNAASRGASRITVGARRVAVVAVAFVITVAALVAVAPQSHAQPHPPVEHGFIEPPPTSGGDAVGDDADGDKPSGDMPSGDESSPPDVPTANDTDPPAPHAPLPCPLPIPATVDTLDAVADTTRVLAPTHRLATGEGIRVAVIDTGIHPHPRLKHLTDGGDFTNTGGAFDDCDGHGTIVAGIIAAQPQHTGTSEHPADGLIGIAPDAQLISIKQSTAYTAPDTHNTSGSLWTLTQALHAALTWDPHVITMSIAACVDTPVVSELYSSPLGSAIREAEERGILMVAAAGNRGGHCPDGAAVIPAAFDEVIAVSARRTSISFEDYAMTPPPGGDSALLVSAPGTIAAGLNPHGPGLIAGIRTSEGDAALAGTSFAAPFVAGALALLRQHHPTLSPAQVRALLSKVTDPATGAVDPHALLSAAPTAYSITEEHHGPEHPEPLALPRSTNPHNGAALGTIIATSGSFLLAVGVITGVRRHGLGISRRQRRTVHTRRVRWAKTNQNPPHSP